MNRRLLLIETSDIGAGYCAQAAEALGFEPVYLCDLKHYKADTLAQIRSYRHYDVNTLGSRELARFIESKNIHENLHGIISLQDSRLRIASELALHFGVQGNDPAILRLKDKAFCYKLVPESIPITISFSDSLIPVDELLELQEIYGRLIVKPTQGAGGIGILHVHSPEDVLALPKIIANAEVPSDMNSGRWLAQPFLEGMMFSLEGFIVQGQTQFLGFTGRRKVGTTETGAQFPIDHNLKPAVRVSAMEGVKTLASRSGFMNGYFHVEFIEHDGRAYMIDPNMGRVGGGPIAELLALSFDVSPVQVFKHLINLTIRHLDENNPYTASVRKPAASILYGLRNGGTIDRVSLPLNHACLHTQILGTGTTASPVGRDDWSWVGILSGTLGEVETVADAIRIITQGGIEERAYF